MRTLGLALILVAGSQSVARAQSPGDWADRLQAKDPKARATAEAALVQDAPRSFPVLRRLLASEHEDLHEVTFDIIRRIGPPAIPLLVELLRNESDAIRRSAVDVLIDFAPHTEGIQPALRRALRDEDSDVAGDAARALGALGERASPSAGALVTTLSHENPYVRIYAAEALASIGPNAATATGALAGALGDPVPGVRWAACEALASIGPAAEPAVPRLIDALGDEFLYVRIFAAGALGSIGPKAAPARDALKAAADDPRLRDEAEWALSRIAGVKPGEPVASRDVPAPSVPAPLRTPIVPAGNPPVDWDTATGRNIAWSVELGRDTFGRPVVAGDAVYVGTDNSRRLNPAFQEEAGVLAAFRVKDGTFLWQDVAPRVERGLREWLLPSTTSAPYVEGNRLYYVTAECQLRCLDTEGFRDGDNAGPYRDEAFRDAAAADIVWELDMCGRLGVFPHEATNSDVLPAGDLLIVSTSNGQNEGHTRVPAPRAPSLIAVDKRSGDVVWRATGAGAQVLHGQWSSPVAADVNGRLQVLFGGGDGWLRAYDAASGHEVWRFDGNPKDARWLPRPGVLSRGSIIASPVFADGRVFVAMGQSPGHGNGPSLMHAISPNGQGDVTGSRLLWTSREVGRVVGTPIARNGLLYVGDLGGTIHCLDAATGAQLWTHDTNEPIWGSLMLTGDRLYVGNEAGIMTVLRAGGRKEVLGQIEMNAPIYTPPAPIGDALYLATENRLYRITATTASLVEEFKQEPVFWRQLVIAEQLAERNDPSVLPSLVEWLGHDDRHIRANVALIFARLGDPRGFPAITAILDDRSDRPEGQDGRPMSSLGVSRYSVSRQIASDRYYAAHVLGDLRDPRGIPVLVALLDDPDVKMKVPWSLARIGDPRAVAPLLAALDRDDPTMRVLVIDALVTLRATEAVPRLASLVNDHRRSSFGAQASVSEAATAAIATLK